MNRFQLCLTASIVILAMSYVPAPKTFLIDRNASSASWRWHAAPDPHSGTVFISSGEFVADNGIIRSGTVRVDLNSITVSTVRDLRQNAQVSGWLKGRDFFDTYNHPLATLSIASVRHEPDNRCTLKGSLTLRGNSIPVQVPATVMLGKKTMEISAQLVLRQPKSTQKDSVAGRTADDSFKVNLHLVANRK